MESLFLLLRVDDGLSLAHAQLGHCGYTMMAVNNIQLAIIAFHDLNPLTLHLIQIRDQLSFTLSRRTLV